MKDTEFFFFLFYIKIPAVRGGIGLFVSNTPSVEDESNKGKQISGAASISLLKWQCMSSPLISWILLRLVCTLKDSSTSVTVAKVAVPAAGAGNTIAFCTSGLKIKVVPVTALAVLNIYCYYTSVVQQ